MQEYHFDMMIGYTRLGSLSWIANTEDEARTALHRLMGRRFGKAELKRISLEVIE